MIDIRTVMTRSEIEEDWIKQGFEKLFEEDDDQIWVNEDRDELFYMTWMNGVGMVFKRDQIVYLRI